MKLNVIKVCAGLIIILALLMCSSTATETTWRFSGFELYGYDINFTNHDALNIGNLTAENITSELIGGVIYADQYDNIQDAINATDEDGDNKADYKLKIPCGTYPISTALYPFTNSHISGCGVCSELLIDNNVSVHGFYLYNDADVLISDIYINMSLAGNQTTLGGGRPSGIFVGDGSSDFNLNTTIEHVRIHGAPEAGIIFLNGVTSTVSNCFITDSDYGIHTDANKDILIDNVDIHNCTWGIRSSNTSGLMLSNSYIQDISNYGISFGGTTHSIISNNVLDTCTHAGIVDEITTEGGVYHEGGANIITQNYIYNSSSSAGSINLDTNRSLASNNYISRSGRMGGIRVTGMNNTIINNYIYNPGALGTDGKGLEVYGGHNNIFRGNKVVFDTARDANPIHGAYGIALSGSCTNNIFTDNDVSLCQIAKDFSAGYYNNNTFYNNNGVPPYYHGYTATAPSPFGAGDEYYNSTDNIKYCYDGSAWEDLSDVGYYGEAYIYNNAVDTVIETANTPIALRQISSGLVNGWTFDAGSTGGITAYADGTGGTVLVSDAGHGLSNGDIITIRGTTNYNGVFTVSAVTTDNFKITDTWVNDNGASDWDQGASLTAGANSAGKYTVRWQMSSAPDAAMTCNWVVYINAVAQTKTMGERNFAQNDYGCCTSMGILDISAGDVVWLALQSDGTQNVLNKHGNFNVRTV